jgi:hypothetical protein
VLVGGVIPGCVALGVNAWVAVADGVSPGVRVALGVKVGAIVGEDVEVAEGLDVAELGGSGVTVGVSEAAGGTVYWTRSLGRCVDVAESEVR